MFHRKTVGSESLLNKVVGLIKFIKKETLAQVFSLEFCEIFKNNFFSRTPPVAFSTLRNQVAVSEKNVMLRCNKIFPITNLV